MAWRTSGGRSGLWLGRDVQTKETGVAPETDPDVLEADMANFQTPPRAIVPYDGISDKDDQGDSEEVVDADAAE